MAIPNSKYNVLIVDDVTENIQVISSILYQHGLNISLAQSGQEALNIIFRKPPDLILLDIIMPEMDGFEVCKYLQLDPTTKDIPIIFLTAKTQADDIVKGFECGAVDYISKPFHTPELLSRVFTHLELKKSRDLISTQNQQLAEQNEKLRELNATKDKFFSIIAHDLKNPFHGLLTILSVLRENFKSYNIERIERYVEIIYNSLQQGYALLENLLEWSLSQTGQIQFYPQAINVKESILESLTVLESAAAQKNIAIHTEIPENMVAYADPNMLATIMRNFLSNAIKFTESHGNVTIRVQDTGNWVKIAVSDTGIGIKEEDLKKLFRLDLIHSTLGTAREKGTGLGLILCKEFIETHGGEILVESNVGNGSHFTFTLPKPNQPQHHEKKQ